MSADQERPRGRRSLATRAIERGIGMERKAAGVLGIPDLGDVLTAALGDTEVQESLAEAFRSDGAKEVVEDFFDSPLFDQVVAELLASPALWRLVDEIAASPAVTAAITQQGFGFADQIGQEVRSRSRRADDWAERVAHRLRPRSRRGGSETQTGTPSAES